jgi:uncharacterized tellurite resistance protein B-like protein
LIRRNGCLVMHRRETSARSRAPSRMLRNLKEIFETLLAPPDAAGAPNQCPRLAAAVLLAEVMRADAAGSVAEHRAVRHALQREFGLAEADLDLLVAQAEAEGRAAYDYHRFTSTLNEQCSQPQKIALVEAMWRVAYADARVAADESHLISKIAGLLHVTQGEYIGAKMRAKEDAGLLRAAPAG